MTVQQIKSDTAVSEALGYILITGILVVTLGLIYTIGYPIYNSYVDNGHMQNMQQSFKIVSDNGNMVALHKSPYSSSEVKMYGGRLANRTTGYINISFYQDTAGASVTSDSPWYYNTSLQALEYTKGASRVAYVAGSVCTNDSYGPYMMYDPGFYNTSDTLVIPLVALYNTNIMVTGDGLTRLSFFSPYYAKMSQTVIASAITGYNVKLVKITVSGDYADCFGDYLSSSLEFTKTHDSNGEIEMSRQYPGGITVYIVPCYLTVQAK